MRQSISSYLAVLAILAGLSFFPLAMPASSSIDVALDPRFSSIPLEIGEWKGKDISPGEDVYRILETKNILSRLYENSNGERIDLLLVSSDKDRRVAHPPEVCYTSSHYAIIDSGESTLHINGQELPVSEFTAQNQLNPDHQEKVLYLYQVGERFTTNYYAQQFQFAMDRLSRKESQVLLIRLSGSTREPFQQFLAQILAHISD